MRANFPLPNRCNVRLGSWLCENAKALNRYKRSYSSKTVSGIQFENTFDLEIELKNVILVAFQFFAFSHSQGQFRKSALVTARSALPPGADIVSLATHVRFAPTAAVNENASIIQDSSLLTDQSKLTNHVPWRGQGN